MIPGGVIGYRDIGPNDVAALVRSHCGNKIVCNFLPVAYLLAGTRISSGVYRPEEDGRNACQQELHCDSGVSLHDLPSWSLNMSATLNLACPCYDSLTVKEESAEDGRSQATSITYTPPQLDRAYNT